MTNAVAPLSGPPLLLGHHGASSVTTAGTAEAFRLALRIGADGLHSTARTDPERGVVVGPPPRRFRRGPTGTDLSELASSLGDARAVVALSVDDADTAAEAVRWARVRGAVEHLWLFAGDTDLLGAVRSESEAVRLFHLGDPKGAERGPERHVAQLREAGLDGLVVPEDRITAGLVALAHRFGRMVVAAGADHHRTARRAVGNGVDALTGGDVEVLRAARDGDPPPPR